MIGLHKHKSIVRDIACNIQRSEYKFWIIKIAKGLNLSVKLN